MSKSGYCLIPLYETQTSYASGNNVSTVDRWVEVYIQGTLKYGDNILYSSSTHVNIDAARGCWLGYQPANKTFNYSGSYANQYNCVGE